MAWPSQTTETEPPTSKVVTKSPRHHPPPRANTTPPKADLAAAETKGQQGMDMMDRRRAMRAVQSMAAETDDNGQRSPIWDEIPLDRQVALYQGMKLMLPDKARLSRKLFQGWLVQISSTTKIRRKFWVVPIAKVTELVQAGRLPADAVVRLHESIHYHERVSG